MLPSPARENVRSSAPGMARRNCELAATRVRLSPDGLSRIKQARCPRTRCTLPLGASAFSIRSAAVRQTATGTAASLPKKPVRTPDRQTCLPRNAPVIRSMLRSHIPHCSHVRPPSSRNRRSRDRTVPEHSPSSLRCRPTRTTAPGAARPIRRGRIASGSRRRPAPPRAVLERGARFPATGESRRHRCRSVTQSARRPRLAGPPGPHSKSPHPSRCEYSRILADRACSTYQQVKQSTDLCESFALLRRQAVGVQMRFLQRQSRNRRDRTPELQTSAISSSAHDLRSHHASGRRRGQFGAYPRVQRPRRTRGFGSRGNFAAR